MSTVGVMMKKNKSDKLISTPKSVKKTKVAEPPQEGYEAYLYQYTNLNHPLKKAYVGIHKGDYNDGYTNSSTNKEFKEELANPNSNFLYEVREYGTYELMSVRENDILTIGREENKDAWYNKTNGSPKFKVPDFDAINLLVEQVKNKVFPVTKMTREELEKLEFLQVRTESFPKLIQDIAQAIDEGGGDTSDCEPIVIFEGRGQNSEDVGGDGYHSCGGGLSSEKMMSMSVIRISLSENKFYTNTELKTFSHQMNAGDRIHKNPATEDDLKKQLYVMITDAGGEESVLDHPNVKGWLVNKMYKTKKKSNGLIKSIKSQWKRDEDKEADKTWRHYTDGEFDRWAAKYREGDPDSIVIQVNSNWVKYDDIMRDLEMNLERDKNGKLIVPIIPEKSRVTFLIRHKSGAHVDPWDDRIGKNLKTRIYPYIILLGMKPKIEALPTQIVSDLGVFNFTHKEAA